MEAEVRTMSNSSCNVCIDESCDQCVAEQKPPMPQEVQQVGGYATSLSSILVMMILFETEETMTKEAARERLEQWVANDQPVSVQKLATMAKFLDEKRGGR
jgi:hypothetical protein